MHGAMEGRRRVTIATGDAAFTVRYAATADAAVTQTDDVFGRRSQGTQTGPTANDKRLELEQTRLDEYRKRRHPDGGNAAPKKRRPPDEGSEDIG